MQRNKREHIFLSLIDEIESCLENELYLAALCLALTLPDICGRAEYSDKMSIAGRYIGWYNKYMDQYHQGTSPYAADMPYLSGEVVYNLRNSLLHSGNPNINSKKVKQEECQIDRFELCFEKSFSGDTSCVAYGAEMKIVKREYSVNAYLLCYRLCRVTREYFQNNKEKFDFFDYHLTEV